MMVSFHFVFVIYYFLTFWKIQKKTQMDGNGIGVSNFHGGPEQIFRTMFKRTNLKRVEERVEKNDKKRA